MDIEFEMNKICPNCGKAIRSELKFCNYCGIDLGKYEVNCPKCGKSIKMNLKFCTHCGTSLIEQKPDKIEITEDFKNLRLVPICMCLIPMLILIIIAAFIGATQQVIAFFVAFLCFVGFYVFLELVWIRYMAKQRRFIISNDLIMFDVPKKPLFQIKWDDFVKLEITETKTPWYTTSLVSPYKVFNNLAFYTEDNKYYLYTLVIKWDFKKKACLKILSLLEDYCAKFHKEFTIKK
jgi:hypothetical protein